MSVLAFRRLTSGPSASSSVVATLGRPRPVSVRAALLERRRTQLQPRGPWTNWIGDLERDDLRQAAPATIDQVAWLVDQALAEGSRVRPLGSGHSSSSAGRPDDIAVSMERLRGIRRPRWLRADAPAERLRHVLAGTRVKTLNHELSGRLALANMGSFDGQTVAGALSTGTHGSSLHTGPMADSVRSVDIVVSEGRRGLVRARAYRIEPSDGITNPSAFDRAVPDHGMELVQDDATFHSVVVSFGSVGIIVGLTLELVEPYWLEEANSALRWDDLRLLLRPEEVEGWAEPVPRLLVEDDFVEFLVNAAEVQHGGTSNPMCLLRRRNRVPRSQRPVDWTGPWPPRRVPSPLDQVFTEAFVRPRIDNATGRVVGVVDIGDSIARNFRNVADRAPFEHGRTSSESHLVLRRERDELPPDAAPEPPPAAISNEIAVPLHHTVRVVDRVLDVMRSSEHFFAVPFGVRFTAPSRHFLAPQHGRPTTLVEVPMVLPSRARRRRRALPHFKAALEQVETALCHSVADLDGRPHWGQHHALDPQRLARVRYPELEQFLSVRRRFNAGGVFDNDHTTQLTGE